MKHNLQKLLREFNMKGYADPTIGYHDNGKDGKILKIAINDYTYEDEFYGGEPYSGNETIWYKGTAIFRCVYWGKVIPGIQLNEIYMFLRKALNKGPDGTAVHRGSTSYTEGEYTYTNECHGTIDEFSIVEKISIGTKEVYIAWLFGGLINVQKE